MKKQKPKLRGISHLAAFVVSLIAGPYLVLQAAPDRGGAALGAGIYAFALIFLFGMSALYHVPTWGTLARSRMRRLDHSAIFLLIAGTATPLALAALEPSRGRSLLLLIWTGAGVGILKTLVWIRAPKWLTAAVAVGAGFLALPFFPALLASIGTRNSMLLLFGGVLYVIGAVVYALKRPDPAPELFGYHEIFHALVIAAAALHYTAVLDVLLARSA